MKRGNTAVAVFAGLAVVVAMLMADTPPSRWLRAASEALHGNPGVAPAASLIPHVQARPMPDLAFSGRHGEDYSLADFRGRVVLLNVWATWCAPCREEMPALDRLQDKLGASEFEVVALSVDTGGVRAVERFYRELGLQSLEIYWDPHDSAVRTLGIVGLPTTLLVDRNGREIARSIGPARWDEDPVLALLRQYADDPARKSGGLAPGAGTRAPH